MRFFRLYFFGVFYGILSLAAFSQTSEWHPFDYSRLHARSIETVVRMASNAIQGFGKQDSAAQVKAFEETIQMVQLQKQACDTFPINFKGNTSLHKAALVFFSKAQDSLVPGFVWLARHATVYPPDIKTQADLSPEDLEAYMNLNGINQLLTRYFNEYQAASKAFDQEHQSSYSEYACFALQRAMDLTSKAQKQGVATEDGPFIFDIKGFWDKNGPAGPKLNFTFGKGPVQGVGQIKPQFDRLIESFKQCLPSDWSIHKVELVGGISWHIQSSKQGWGHAPYAVVSLEQRGRTGEMTFWIQVFP